MNSDVQVIYDNLNTIFKKYKGKSTNELKKKFGIDVVPKNVNYIIFKKMIEESENYSEIKNKLKESSFIFKTVNLEWNNLLKESMSLKTFKYLDIVNEEWENSSLRRYFAENYFIFIVLKKDTSDSFFEKIVIWKMPQRILDSGVKNVWEDTKNKIIEGNIVNYIDSRDRTITNFLSCRDTRYIHVRPHARNKNDTLPLPINDKVTDKKEFVKHSFWLNRNFIKQIVVEGKNYE